MVDMPFDHTHALAMDPNCPACRVLLGRTPPQPPSDPDPVSETDGSHLGHIAALERRIQNFTDADVGFWGGEYEQGLVDGLKQALSILKENR